MSTRYQMKVASWLNIAQHIIFPGTCILCHKASRRQLDLCTDCEQHLAGIENPCTGCALPLPADSNGGDRCGACLSGSNLFRQAHIPFGWQPPLSSLISQFKYHRKLHCGRVCGCLLESLVRHRYRDQPLPELLLPVPLSDRKLRSRGYNQARLIAAQLSRALSLPLLDDLVIRQRDTPAQQGLSAARRRRNLRGAFIVNGNCSLSSCPARVAVIDDVVTTMSTANALAAVLRQQWPDTELHLWALARA